MERLTKRLEDGQAVMDCAACGVSWHKKRKKDIPYCTALFCRNRLKERLAAYEDTGLEPGEIYEVRFLIAAQRDPQKLARLRELVLADQNGQLVVLPCKVGDKVYVTDLTDGQVEECEVACFGCIDGTGVGLIEYNAPPDYPRIVSVECGLDEIGKTVFLTREEAEAALSGKGGESDA